MAIYRVHSASLSRRGNGLLVVTTEVRGGRHGGHGLDLEVEGWDGKTVRFRGGRIVWDENNEISEKWIMFIEPPGFSIEELKGRKLLGSEPGPALAPDPPRVDGPV